MMNYSTPWYNGMLDSSPGGGGPSNDDYCEMSSDHTMCMYPVRSSLYKLTNTHHSTPGPVWWVHRQGDIRSAECWGQAGAARQAQRAQEAGGQGGGDQRASASCSKHEETGENWLKSLKYMECWTLFRFGMTSWRTSLRGGRTSAPLAMTVRGANWMGHM